MKQKDIFKCNVCGKVIEILSPGVPETVCCGQPMDLIEEKSGLNGRLLRPLSAKLLPKTKAEEEGILDADANHRPSWESELR